MLSTLNRIRKYSQMKPTLLKLDYILNYGSSRILEQSQFLHKELPIRISHRIKDLQNLPTKLREINELQNVHDLYVNSFNQILDFSPLFSSEDSNKFINLIKNIREKHTDIEIHISSAIQ